MIAERIITVLAQATPPKTFTLDLELLVWVCAAMVTISGAVAIIVKIFNNTSKSIISKANEQFKETADQMVQSISKKLDDFIEEARDTDDKLKAGILATHKERINYLHDYYMSKGFIGAHSLATIEDMFKSYQSLGGNSYIEKMMQDLRSLPVRSAESMLRQYQKEQKAKEKELLNGNGKESKGNSSKQNHTPN